VDTVTFTAGVSVTAPGGGVPTGSVDFYDATTLTDLGSIALVNGAASLSTGALTVGNQVIVATYSGDGDFLSSAGSGSLNVLPPASLSGTVFADFNDDGQIDFGENGISGVSVHLTGADDLGHAVDRTFQTDGDGAFLFLNLRPGSYYLTKTTQPSGYTAGIDSVGTAGGSLSTTVADQFFVQLGQGVNGLNYNYGEVPAAGGPVQKGQTAGIGFWNNKNGHALILALNGGGASHELGDWLAATFVNLYGAKSRNNLAGQSNAYVAALFQQDFLLKGMKLDAQVLATALSVYATNTTLDNTQAATKYGFTVSGYGVGTATFNVGSNGAAFGVANNTTVTVMDLLLAADRLAVDGLLYNGDATDWNLANNVFSALNQAGSIS
jgi:SdrD B-like domain/Bacterial Ig-like domain (group 3)